MAKVVTISWVRRRRGDSAAADFGTEFGKQADIDSIRVEHDKHLNAKAQSTGTALKLVRTVCGITPRLISAFIVLYMDVAWRQEFIERHNKPPRRKKKAVPRKRVSSARAQQKAIETTLHGLDTLETITVVLDVIQSAPAGTFDICTHAIDMAAIDLVNRDNAGVVCTKCGDRGSVYLQWDDDEEEEEVEDEPWDE